MLAPTPKTLESLPQPRPPTPWTSSDGDGDNDDVRAASAAASSGESKRHHTMTPLLPSLASLLPTFRSFYSSPATFDKIFNNGDDDSGLIVTNGQAGSSPPSAAAGSSSSFRFAAAVHLRLSKRIFYSPPFFPSSFFTLSPAVLLSTRAAIYSPPYLLSCPCVLLMIPYFSSSNEQRLS